MPIGSLHCYLQQDLFLCRVLASLLSSLEKKEAKPELYKEIDPAANNNVAIRWASERGCLEVVKLLLEKKEKKPELYGKIDPAANDNEAIREATLCGYVEVVKSLLDKKEK